MTIDKWIKSVLGKYVKYNKSTKGYQCVDLAKSYLVDCFKFFHCFPSLEANWAWGNARDWYENYADHKELVKYFKRISNTPSFVPIKGDILVFTENNKYGHICIAYNDQSTTKKIYSIDQNYPTGSKVKYCTHYYTSEGFLGVLRPRDRIVSAPLNVRSEPSMDGKILRVLNEGDKVFINNLDSTKKWARIGRGEWVSYRYIEEIGYAD
ncbi:MAG: CHAP domain-containing protein [Clostridia bacterium]|nr:CHAP domain-containing protein [Clostridia bacterium]